MVDTVTKCIPAFLHAQTDLLSLSVVATKGAEKPAIRQKYLVNSSSPSTLKFPLLILTALLLLHTSGCSTLQQEACMTLLLPEEGGSQNTVMLVDDTEADVMTIPAWIVNEAMACKLKAAMFG